MNLLNKDPYFIIPAKTQEITFLVFKKMEKKGKSLKCAIIVVYNWLNTLTLLRNEIDSLSKSEVRGQSPLQRRL